MLSVKIYRRFGLSLAGILLAIVFFAASLSPSLLPRTYLVQGLLSGFALITGYAVGVSIAWLYDYLQLPGLKGKYRAFTTRLVALGALSIAGIFLWRATTWQNSIRELMDMEPVASTHPWYVGMIAILLAALLLITARGIRRGYCSIAARMGKLAPPRISAVVSVTIVIMLLFSLLDKIVIKQALSWADEVFLQLDELIEDNIAQPKTPMVTGSAESLISWETIGRRGKHFIVTGPTQDQLNDFHGRETLRPIRVYAGFGSKDSPEERARLALEELKRVHAFARSVLVIATPTGTGWLDPGAVDSLEYLHAGDTAIVVTQYSYLPSWMTLLVDPERSKQSARALFNEVYAYWTSLPKDGRPRLYLHGLSLGALGSESSTELFMILEDLIDGAVWSGPPFPSALWSRVVRARNPGTPAWLPQFNDGSLIRFTQRENQLAIPGARWGPVRIVYIQHASDPMTFFSPQILYKKPDWLAGERGPDVSAYLSWYPIITFLQLAFDIPMATTVPRGYGHNIGASSYIDAWKEVTDPKGWNAGRVEQLKTLLEVRDY